MAFREFVDSLGTSWRVWNNVPLASAMLTGEMKHGWLTFESTTRCVRRLAPVPENWEQLSADQLEQLCDRAAEVPSAMHNELPRPELAKRNPNH